ncbi:DUF3069 domain-containing protein [Aliivibrio sifiae]|uniref:DUF3069 domain-containing protein n=1 Tax=Aliivibrio sifiae TaxID=566293 RepID=A0A2S7X878_9GAMM|nr:DUF3069 domain-containing protein [Aliivibrio sifiae]PQJ87332.1 hypothetical protein BTO23_14540 [Aliivibrio sifiae]GLR76138.1 hypothetical protein GCM10007855_30130 [Aliivibrio sifiae]
MSEVENTQKEAIDLATISPELKKVIEFESVPEEMWHMLVSVHEVAEVAVRESWDEMPASAQKVLDNFEQFHALVSLSQSYAGYDFMAEFETIELPENMDEDAQAEYRSQLLDQVLHNCVKDLVKQIKKARRDPIMKRELAEIFKK